VKKSLKIKFSAVSVEIRSETPRKLKRKLLGKTEGKRTFGDGKGLSKCILKENDARLRIGYIWLRIRSSGGMCCEHRNETSCSVTDGEFLDQFSNCQLLKEDSDLRNYLVVHPETNDVMTTLVLCGSLGIKIDMIINHSARLFGLYGTNVGKC
jgi:hypothetical protein